jgi:hypothetical protein
LSSASRTEFSAWLWVPNVQLRARGFATVRLAIHPGRLVVTPKLRTDALKFVLGIPDSIEYDWPAVVLERFWPTGSSHILLDVGGRLGSVGIARSRGRVAQALMAAGFSVVERTRVGWEKPRPVAREELGGAADWLPACVIRT